MPKDDFPQTIDAKGDLFTLRLMDRQDRDALLALAERLSEDELLFMRRDITQSGTIDEWIREIEMDQAITILAEYNGTIVGYGSLYYNQLFWSRHMAEVRVMVTRPYRSRGLGTHLVRELVIFAQGLNLEKVTIGLAVEDRGAQRMVERLGFKAEALLTDWLKTRDNTTHDLLIMSTSLANVPL